MFVATSAMTSPLYVVPFIIGGCTLHPPSYTRHIRARAHTSTHPHESLTQPTLGSQIDTFSACWDRKHKGERRRYNYAEDASSLD